MADLSQLKSGVSGASELFGTGRIPTLFFVPLGSECQGVFQHWFNEFNGNIMGIALEYNRNVVMIMGIYVYIYIHTYITMYIYIYIDM